MIKPITARPRLCAKRHGRSNKAACLTFAAVLSLASIAAGAGAQEARPTIVLVGHSYGGTVITNAAGGRPSVRALVYVAALAPDSGETPGQLTAHDPGATLGAALAPPVALPDGGKDIYFDEPSGAPAWKSVPSWFIYGTADLNIAPATHAFMARRANAKETVAVNGASHVVMISHPDAVATLIEHASTWKR